MSPLAIIRAGASALAMLPDMVRALTPTTEQRIAQLSARIARLDERARLARPRRQRRIAVLAAGLRAKREALRGGSGS